MIDALQRWFEGLRFPLLLALTAIAVVINVLVPDVLPFIDEIALILITILLGRLKRRDRDPGKGEGPENGASSK